MPIWTSEIKELEKLYEFIKGRSPDLEKELERLIKADDENMILLYSRRCLEVIITDLCECELKRPRKTEPLKGIIDKLHKEEKVPSHIISSMYGLNELSTYGAHPKDFDPQQVKPVLNNLDIIIKWYLEYKEPGTEIKAKPADETRQENKGIEEAKKSIQVPKKKLIGLVSGLILLIAVVVTILLLTDIIGGGKITNEIEKSIAILPFRNDSPDSTNLYFCNGMMEDILDNLVKIVDLNVKSRTDAEPYRATSKSIRDIGRELGVANILEGSVRRQGDRFKVSVQLILAETGFHLWSNTYEGEYSEEIFTVSSNIAQEIALALNAIITMKERETIERIPTTNLAAYDFYTRGKYEISKYWVDRDVKHILEGQKLLDKAIEIDPKFEKALQEKAGSYLGLKIYDSVLIYANNLLKIDPKSGDGYFMKGEAYRFAGVSDSAIENYMLAIKYLRKDRIEDKKWSEFSIGSVYCSQKNDFQKGLPWLQKGFYLEEGECGWGQYEMLGWLFSLIGDYEKSDKYFMKSLECEVTPVNIQYFSLSLLSQSKITEALNFLDTICQQSESLIICSKMRFSLNLFRKEFGLAKQCYNQFLAAGGKLDALDSIFLSYMYKETGKEQESLIILKKYEKSLEVRLDKVENWNLYLNLSLLHAILNQKDETNRYLSKYVDVGRSMGWHDLLEICPIFEDLHGDLEFKAITKRVQDEAASARAQVLEMEKRGEIDVLLSLITNN